MGVEALFIYSIRYISKRRSNKIRLSTIDIIFYTLRKLAIFTFISICMTVRQIYGSWLFLDLESLKIIVINFRDLYVPTNNLSRKELKYVVLIANEFSFNRSILRKINPLPNLLSTARLYSNPSRIFVFEFFFFFVIVVF